MSTGRLPGFQLEPELTRLPEQEPSLTAVPVFMGYVQKLDAAQLGVPVYITRYAEFERRFCVYPNGDNASAWVFPEQESHRAAFGPFLRSSIQLYFLNGGGPCYVLPVAKLGDADRPRMQDFDGVIHAINLVPEITTLVPTDAILLDPADYAQFCSNLLAHCENTGRFCILDAGSSAAMSGNGCAQAKDFCSRLAAHHLKWGAAYFPFLQMRPRVAVGEAEQGSATTASKIALPSAVAAAAFGVTDKTRGVWKAPANFPVRGILGIATQPSLSEMGELYDPEDGRSINFIRSIHGRGIFLWGTRTLDGHDQDWRYINVRRLVSFVESSLRDRTVFAVFEPNSIRTWIVVKGICDAFLRSLWEEGGLAGAQQKEAYEVTVALGESMTQADIDEGRLIAQVRIAPKRPAEFITLKIFHQVQALGH